MLHPNQFNVNDAWILFQLNAAPIQTDVDGSFNCMALMDAASRHILGSEMVSTNSPELSKLAARRLLKKSAGHKKELPKALYIACESAGDELAREAECQHIEVVRVPQSELLIFVREAQESFQARFG